MGCCLFDCIGGFVLGIFRWALFLLNLLFVVAGISMIVVGSIALINVQSVDDFIADQAEIGAIILISTGGITFLVSFLGCCGAIKRTPWMMNTYGALLFILFAVQLAGGILAFSYKSEVETEFKDSLTRLAKLYYLPSFGGEQFAKDAWDKMQSEQFCCGVESFRDWVQNRPELQPAIAPESCDCTNDQDGCDPRLQIFTVGCYTKIQPYLGQMIDALGGIGIAVSLFELVAGVFALCLANSFSDRKRSKISV
ncbi:tetraspanin-6-like [Neocloeon triangulifer]|uniref:tetraspanin-6-like n=1 Tax=Neocloeon triangulifer TaxID=2078957 RepID=UPI00286F3516|nr:tetraspanin-6-like [Neocloeon triangulifer]